jgi:hypothetical protein
MVTYQPDIIGMRERVIIDNVPRKWYKICEKTIEYYRHTIPCLFEERNNIVHKGQKYRFKDEHYAK